jgi:hypothetical protein
MSAAPAMPHLPDPPDLPDSPDLPDPPRLGQARRYFLQEGARALTSLALGSGLAAAPHARAEPDATPESLPDWAPEQPGTLRVLATRNSFLSQNSRLPGWESAFGTLVDDYSGGVFNPYWGRYGAMVFHGGGHSATFDNSVVLLDLNDLAFKRVSNPTLPQGGRHWADARQLPGGVDTALDVAHCEYGDGQPGAGHSYDALAILPPDAGGAACGSLLRVASFAVHVNASCNTGWAQRFDFPSTTLREGRWRRASGNTLEGYLAPGGCSAWDSRRQRVWWLASLTSAPGHVRYLDVASGQQMQVPLERGAGLAPFAAPDSATLRYDPAHDLLLMTCSVGRDMVLAYLRCAQPQAGWVVPTLSQHMPSLPNASVGFDRVAPLQTYVLLSAADSHAVYALRIPDALAEPWPLVRQPLQRLELPTARVVGKRWSYCEAARCFVWMASSSSPVVAYRPLR